MDDIPPEAFLAGYPGPMRAIAERLRGIVRAAVPDVLEAVRLGWRLIGYDAPRESGSAYFCWIAPEPEHVHLGFHWGIAMNDPERLLKGAGITRRVRWLTFRPGDPIDAVRLQAFVDEARRVAFMSPGERLARRMDRADESAEALR